MLIKQADDRLEEIADLNQLLAEPGLNASQRKRIQEEISNSQKGAWGEQQAAYYLNFHFEGYKNNIILHDLRIVLSNEKTAQIDHLIINRRLNVYVLESKNWKQLTVDQTGACTIWNGRLTGVPSPLEQCRRHAAILKRVFEIHPELKALAPRQEINCRVLLAPECHLKAPHHQEWYMKADAFHSAWEKEMDNDDLSLKNVLAITRLISRERLYRIGELLVQHHNPGRRDWRARFGLPAKVEAPPNRVVESITGLADYVPRWGSDWFVLKGKPTDETKKALKSAGYRASQENGEWVWRLKTIS